ncbi:NADH-cytochrome b5 reductase-like [Podila clonocystis]|nr:NADH-cytochrome b5 reductase-like [Podila clonocystis]
MTNPAVAKWLAEIAGAKAKADAKKRTQGPAPPLALTNTPTQSHTISTASPSIPAAPTALAISYGIITSYNLRTRQKQLRLVLPPEPRKPGPGECCGNDCDPCVNTLYYQDLQAYKQTVQELKQQYEQACSDLKNGVTEATAVSATASSAIQLNNDEEKALSVRAYRPFQILKKQRLADNTLLIVCDTPSPSIVDSKLSTFHILIRFKLPQPDTASGYDQNKDKDQNQSRKEQNFVTKAFTPVDLPTSHGKLTFLVKLYPAPHRTSEMFRALRVWSSPSTSKSAPDRAQDAEMGVLYLRGPVRTGFDLDHQTHQIPGRLQLGQGKNKARRVVMIAAGSGVTPMYQILQQYHAKLARREKDPEQRSTAQGQVELDLIYCNRKRADIWLRQELHAFSASALGTGAAHDGHRVQGGSTRTFVRVQHILSSTDLKSNGLDWTSDLEVDQESDGHNVVTSSGRITPQILQATLTSRHSAWKAETGSGLAALSLGEEEPIQIVICGPEAFNRDVVAMLDQIGYWSGSGRCAIHVLE